MGMARRASEADTGDVRIRTARADELLALQDIERAAGRCFRDIGMAEIADDEPPTLTELAYAQRNGEAWVAVGPLGRLMAYLITDVVDGNTHIEQVSVHPDFARRGIGKALLDHVADASARCGIEALTLTTFAAVPWNAPYYLRCGFRELDLAELTPGLLAILEAERANGLGKWPRVCMRRDLQPAMVPAGPATRRRHALG